MVGTHTTLSARSEARFLINVLMGGHLIISVWCSVLIFYTLLNTSTFFFFRDVLSSSFLLRDISNVVAQIERYVS